MAILHRSRESDEHGFTLVELLVVAVILTILASIVVPQFTTSTDDARNAALDATLARMRSAVDLYQSQHGEYPAVNDVNGAAILALPSPLALPAFSGQLALYTDADGRTTDMPDPNYPYGPYIKKNEVPEEPVSQSRAIVIVDGEGLNMSAVAPEDGWRFGRDTGKFIANTTALENR